MKETMIAQGAEAQVFKIETKIIKRRIEKKYRHPSLDKKIRKGRTKHEAKLLIKAKEAKMQVPKVYNLSKKNEPTDTFTLEIEYIEGPKVRDYLKTRNKKKQKEIMKKIGKEIEKMHNQDIIHGDLTTSNMIEYKNKVYIIDFGLGFISPKIENKAVDLHVIKQALEAKHYTNHMELFEAFKKGYNPNNKDKILERLTAVEKRGRYKH